MGSPGPEPELGVGVVELVAAGPEPRGAVGDEPDDGRAVACSVLLAPDACQVRAWCSDASPGSISMVSTLEPGVGRVGDRRHDRWSPLAEVHGAGAEDRRESFAEQVAPPGHAHGAVVDRDASRAIHTVIAFGWPRGQ